MTRGMLSALLVVVSSGSIVGASEQVDTSTLPLKVVPAFPKLTWRGWSPESESGSPQPIRPILVTHAGDGSNRIFAPTQRGVIHVFDNDPNVERSQIFLDMQAKVVYNDKQNEEGFLGLAFHPDYIENGQFFVYYTTSEEPNTSVVSRFRVSKSDPNRADRYYEEELFRIKQPFWNHNGGTIAFGPDGCLYISLGDGGSARDPHGNGQNLETWLGSILRIDVDRKENGKNYAIPTDNPFVGKGKARPEIWSYGWRNPWRIAFDRETGQMWVADVGQDLWEEINIVTKGGNYGWNLREAMHKFGPNGSDARPDLIDPIWEYHHNIGKSITGGHVYRGKRIPELVGCYVYADYVTGRIWALRYDGKRVVANHEIKAKPMPILSFGEDEDGEVYLTTYSLTGEGIYRFEHE